MIVFYKRILGSTYFLPLLLFFIALFFRTILLDKIPIGIVHDNMIFVLNAKSFFYTGHDVTGKWNPFSLTPIPDEPSQAELPYIYLAPIIGLLPSSLFAAHLFHAVINSIFVLILFLITKKLLGKWPAFLVGLVACFNPWDIFFARSAFETSIAMSFYIFGFYILLNTTGWKKLLAFLPLALGFYTYMAYKVTLIPYTLLISLYIWAEQNHKKYTKQYCVLLLLCIIISVYFLFNAYHRNTINRLGEVTFFSSEPITQQVNFERRIAIQGQLTTIFSNKIVGGGKYLISKYIGAFSPQFLFVDTERTLRFHLYNHGYFYYIDLLFLLIGFCYLFAKKRKLWILITSVILIAPLPSIVSSEGISYAMRSSLYIPFFYILIGTGIWFSLTAISNKVYAISTGILIVGAYLVLITNFMYTYFFIQPIYGSEAQTFSARLTSNYITRANLENKPVTVVLSSPRVIFKDFVYYSNIYTKKSSPQITHAFANHIYTLGHISFITCNQVQTLEKNTIYIFDPGEKCQKFDNIKNTLSIVQLFDSGTVYKIYQDSLCNNYQLKRYISKVTLNDLAIEKLTKENFCEKFIVNYEM